MVNKENTMSTFVMKIVIGAFVERSFTTSIFVQVSVSVEVAIVPDF